jgi:hypothetical protein
MFVTPGDTQSVSSRYSLLRQADEQTVPKLQKATPHSVAYHDCFLGYAVLQTFNRNVLEVSELFCGYRGLSVCKPGIFRKLVTNLVQEKNFNKSRL